MSTSGINLGTHKDKSLWNCLKDSANPGHINIIIFGLYTIIIFIICALADTSLLIKGLVCGIVYLFVVLAHLFAAYEVWHEDDVCPRCKK